jgi:hypothetical protein
MKIWLVKPIDQYYETTYPNETCLDLYRKSYAGVSEMCLLDAAFLDRHKKEDFYNVLYTYSQQYCCFSRDEGYQKANVE